MSSVVESVVLRAAHWPAAQQVVALREQGTGLQPAARMTLASLVELLGG
ncbi:MAG: hypothetical protein HS106_09615 [Ideonella sp.]|nr:hypothetical protein [Ideonella sp.]